MVRYLVRRLLLTLPVLLGVATLVFALIHLVPGDPAQAMLGEGASQEEIAKLQHTLGLDRPLLSQYKSFLVGIGHGDLGTSFRYNAPVAAQIREKFPNTAVLALAAMFVALVLAIPLGIVAAVYRGTFVDHAAMTLALLGICMPNFWLGPLLAILFAVKLGWLPVSGIGRAVAPRLTRPHARRGAGRHPGADDARQRARGAARALRACRRGHGASREHARWCITRSATA